jgi:PAS domain S-box-containing protein
MPALRATLHNLLTSNFPSNTHAETVHRVGMINVFCALGAIYDLVFAAINWSQGSRALAVILGLHALSLAATLAYLRVARAHRPSALFAATLYAILCLILIHHGGTEGLGFLWCFCFPLYAFFSIGLRDGAIAVAVFVAACAVALFWPGNPWLASAYSVPFEVRFFALLVGLGLMSAYAEFARTSSDRARQVSERRFRSLIENGVSVYAIVAADGTVLYESPTLERVYGYSPSELQGTNIMDLVHADDQPAGRHAFGMMLASPGQVHSIEVRYRHRNGSWRVIEVAGVNLIEDPAVGGIVLASHDVTERKQAELEVRALNETLEARVQERTEELRKSEEQLRQFEKLQAIGRLAGGIAHDFNNQLTAIMGCLDMLELELKDRDALGAYLTTALSASRRAADLTSQLLAFSRKSRHISVPVDMREIVAEVISLLRHSIDKRIAIRQALSDDGHVIVGDPAQLQSALLNLAVNARDAMPNGGQIAFLSETVDVDARASSEQGLNIEPGRYLHVTVADTGMGIDAETRTHIFEPFFTTKEPGAGTGMGLAAAYGTARMHRGTLTVDSEPGQGARFHLYFPVAEGAVAKREEPRPEPRSAHRPGRVLVVDDEAAVRDMLALALAKLGYQVVVRQDGAAAVAYYEEQWSTVDVVVLDMVMPNLTGRETFEALRRVHPKVKVILASGYSIETDAQDTLNDGAFAFVQKPFKIAEISQRIAEAVRPS